MLLRTYDKIMDAFHENNGYMSFEKLKERKITVLQIRELVGRDVLDCFSRGWYWCNECGIDRPSYSKYIEIGMVNPRAVICMDSSAYLHGLLKEEPSLVSVATERTDRRKMAFEYPIKRYYLQNAGLEDEIETRETPFGSFQVYSADRTMCDCIRMRDKMSEDEFAQLRRNYELTQENRGRLLRFARALRAYKNVQEYLTSADEMIY